MIVYPPLPTLIVLLGPRLKFALALLSLSFPSYRRSLHCGGFRIRQNLGQKTAIMSEQLVLKGTLKGHNGWVTQIATNPTNPDTILSSSRGKFVLWISIDVLRTILVTSIFSTCLFYFICINGLIKWLTYCA